jgi:hypothetical protein
MNIIYWAIVIILIVGAVAWYLTSKKKGPGPGEMKKPEGPMQPPPTTPGI